MYSCLYGNIPDIYQNYFQRNADHNLRNAIDLYTLYHMDGLIYKKISIKVQD